MDAGDEEDIHAKARHVLRSLRAREVQYRLSLRWICLFCNQMLNPERFIVEQYATGRASLVSKKPGSYKAKYLAFSRFLQDLP